MNPLHFYLILIQQKKQLGFQILIEKLAELLIGYVARDGYIKVAHTNFNEPTNNTNNNNNNSEIENIDLMYYGLCQLVSTPSNYIFLVLEVILYLFIY